MIKISYLEEIKEQDSDGFCFEIRHKILEIPRKLYLERLSDYDDPFIEAAAQELTQEYLDWKNDHGLIGMIRINEDQDNNLVELDAAIRYLVECEESTCDKCQ